MLGSGNFCAEGQRTFAKPRRGAAPDAQAGVSPKDSVSLALGNIRG